MVTHVTRISLLALAATTFVLVLAPLGAAGGDCRPSSHHALRYYLLTNGDGELVMSDKAPSAMNETTWTVEVPSNSTDGSVTVHLHFPAPNHVLSERHGPQGALKASVRHTGALPISGSLAGGPSVEVRIVEGDRAVVLGESSLSSGARSVKLHADYPGHGRGGAPHTHGDGSDEARGLELKDLQVEVTFSLQGLSASAGAIPPLHRHEFAVHIDGRTFLELASDARLSDEGEVEEMYYAHGHTEETWEEYEYDYEGEMNALPSASLGAGLAMVAAAGLAMRRRRA